MTFSSKKSFLSLIDLVPYTESRAWSKTRHHRAIESDDRKRELLDGFIQFDPTHSISQFHTMF